jgi:hypothetical protein
LESIFFFHWIVNLWNVFKHCFFIS